jgi:hypothetical protein
VQSTLMKGPRMNKQVLTILVTALIVLMASDQLKSLPLVNKLPSF